MIPYLYSFNPFISINEIGKYYGRNTDSSLIRQD